MRHPIGTFALSPQDVAYPTLVPQHGNWDDREGGIIAVAAAGSTSVGDIVVIKPDGKWFRLGQGGRTWTGVGWSYDDHLCLTDNTISRMHRGAPWHALDETGGHGGVLNFARLSARVLTFDGNDILTEPLGGGSITVEATITTGNSGPGLLVPYDLSNGRSKWWAIDKASGAVYLYDAVALAEVDGYRTSFGAAVVFAAYDRKHRRWGAVMAAATTTLKMFFDVPQASAIAAPLLTGGATDCYLGETLTAYTTVTGSNGEPCPDRVVTFSSDVLTFAEPSVVTDADGYAETSARAPWSGAGDCTLTAQLVE